eukprot:scaffold244350_cov28-Tisochrysis_lutea.AAC.1
MYAGSSNSFPATRDARPSPAYDTSDEISSSRSSPFASSGLVASVRTLPPAARSRWMQSADKAARAVSGQSDADPGAFLTGANSSSRGTYATGRLEALIRHARGPDAPSWGYHGFATPEQLCT